MNRKLKGSKLRDELSRQHNELLWERDEKEYVFDGPKGKEGCVQIVSTSAIR
jgi:predicted dithiol-disulfide oxidoreductase (DUF899 family)